MYDFEITTRSVLTGHGEPMWFDSSQVLKNVRGKLLASAEDDDPRVQLVMKEANTPMEDDDVVIGRVSATLIDMMTIGAARVRWTEALDDHSQDLYELIPAIRRLLKKDYDTFLYIASVEVQAPFRGGHLGARMVNDLIDNFGLSAVGGACLLHPHPFLTSPGPAQAAEVKKLQTYWRRHGFSSMRGLRWYVKDCTLMDPFMMSLPMNQESAEAGSGS